MGVHCPDPRHAGRLLLDGWEARISRTRRPSARTAGGVQIWHASMSGPAARTVQLRIVTNVRQAGQRQLRLGATVAALFGLPTAVK